MEERIKSRYNKAILQEAMKRYGIADDQIWLLDGFEIFIYEFKSDSEAYILRIGHSFRRSEILIKAEVDWINYLADGGTSVARAILSRDGNLVELIDDTQGGYFLATAFVKAEGKPASQYGWTTQLYETYGQLLGRIHALSKNYRPTDPSWQRPQWDNPIMQDIERNLPSKQTVIMDKYRALMDHINMLPRDNGSYGLIHFDAHAGNFLVDESGKITLFDFDDCAYGWFAYDIAMAIFYMVTNRQNAPELTREFMPHFLRGYRSENSLDPKWLGEIPVFLKHREIDLYALIHRSFDVDNIGDPWCEGYMDGRRHKIEHDVPYIDFDFGSLSQYCL